MSSIGLGRKTGNSWWKRCETADRDAAAPREGSGETELSGRREIVHQSGGNGAIPLKDSIIEVTVEWNGHKEELKLSANKK